MRDYPLGSVKDIMLNWNKLYYFCFVLKLKGEFTVKENKFLELKQNEWNVIKYD